MDLHNAAQQTRIKINYLKALEEEDFSRLPGEVFVKGFLKNYGKFLRLDESEVLKKYLELRPPQPVAVPGADQEPAVSPKEPSAASKTPIEPLIWGAGILITMVAFFFTAMPLRHEGTSYRVVTPEKPQEPAVVPAQKPEKLYLEVIALENTWLLVRTDNSPQKKAVLKTGESLIWSADERFLLSYGSAGALKLQLNGQELTVNEPKNAVVRDLAITATGIVSRRGQAETAKPDRPVRQPVPQQIQSSAQSTAPTATGTPRSPAAASQVKPVPAPLPWQSNQTTAQ
jgi:cytoskeletal protein RodZ